MVSRGEWSVTTRYSWPSAMRRAGHHLGGRAAVAPERVAVAVALERGPQLGALADVDGGLVLELLEVLVDAAVEGQRDDLAGGRADARQVEQRAVGVALGDLVVAELAHEVARLGVGLHPPALRQRPVEQVDDAVEGVGRATWCSSQPTYRRGIGQPTGPVRGSAGPPVPWRTLWSGSGSSVSPTRASRRCTTRWPAAARWPRPYAFATTDPNVGVAQVPDPRLDALAEMSQSKNVVPATVQFVDIGGLVAGRQQGRGPRQQVPQPHPRGRRHRLRAAGLRRRRRARARPTRSSTSASSSSSSPTPTSRRSRTRSRSAARRPRATSRSLDEVAALEQAKADPRDRHADLPLRPDGRRPRAAQAATSCSPTGR